MKKILLLFVVLFSLSAGAYYGLDSVNSYDNERKIADIQRKQKCILKKQKAQEEYTDCLQDCQERKARRRNMGISYVSSSCYCTRPLIVGCY